MDPTPLPPHPVRGQRRRLLVAGNWKMNGSLAGVQALAAAIADGAVARLDRVQLVLFPPFTYLPEAQRRLGASGMAWGAQNVSGHEDGAFTGEVSAQMLREFGCACVLVGHSERRTLFGENDAVVARKFLAVRQAGMTPVLCVGESLPEREQGATEDVVARQLQAVLDLAGASAFADAVVAYEPVWAIGTGKTATPAQAQDVHAFIRGRLAEADPAIAASLHVLYGGSMKRANARELLAMPDIDGGLLGGASLNVDEFMAVAITAQRLAQENT
ncbi:triose-phosphate isomerase [Acidovorax sp. SD340]|mgnify:CR=1 FL=1|jgi:triosephosphate isomerase|uniref:Triosephosphate isomerase n=1 Tax=Cupriavidus metallidurans (strain ATCC 43123 / DSM 2839 / NBRC 102507 / CH34) TaxID=266264 RepID=Q1LN73_CUPMC|nr:MULTISPECIES: triose-phosphate isomerase [Burkholderiales]MBX9794381.1 triose-phosphate isomerase [Burkholderiaceae bacterium]ABF08403.1 triosephosphate isomerase (CbbJ) [Cupriavidus metallidurans CH34]MBO1010221.1 triose-phosphate isomerase [Acidovorax sp. SD340]QGS30629.1 triose-phosphate isomerase [Cupriavidus metallidurans]CAB3698599.1 Triosephosphate isomerase [Achromobacter ruhlandii]